MTLSPEIIYEDSDIVVINKPAGLVVHADGRTQEPSVAEWFAERYPEAREVGEKMGEIERPAIVHRIDRETSGCLVLAKTGAAHEFLKNQFKNREVEKIYHAFVYGEVKDDRGTINLPMGRSAGDFRKFSTKNIRGEAREAITHFEVLKRGEGKVWTFVEAKPKTGRTHQIRVHFQSLGNPVIADPLYAAGKPALLGFARLALHARKIIFHNLKGEKVEVLSPYPKDFQEALDKVDV